MTYIIAQDCIVVKGFLRSVIYDLGRQRYYFIPHQLGDLIRNKKSLQQLMQFPKDETEQDYATFLSAQEIAIRIPESQEKYFKPLSQSWSYPFGLMRCFLKIENDTPALQAILRKLQDASIYELNLVVRSEQVDDVAQALEQFYFPGVNLFLYTPADPEQIARLSHQYPALSFFVTGSEAPAVSDQYQPGNNVQYRAQLPFGKAPGPDDMYVTISAFTETRLHNLFFNKAIFLKDDGYIYDPSWKKSNREFLSYDLEQIDQDAFFTTTWNADKNHTDICRSCEFRRMCNDPRVPQKRAGRDEYYHKSPCNYNPFIAKWRNEEGYLSQEELGTISNAAAYSHDLKKIRKAIAALWN